MANKPIEWRRFEPVELIPETERIVWKQTDTVAAAPAGSLVREFERVLRENERLRIESSSQRFEPSRKPGANAGTAGGTVDTSARDRERHLARVQEDLDAARSQVAHLQSEMAALGQPVPEIAPQTPPTPSLHDMAKIVASYIFNEPSEPQLRLVEDALRSRGIKDTSQ